jgi:GAF domain-containing protein
MTIEPVSLISLVDANRQFFKSHIGLPAPYDTTRETPLTHSFCQHVVTNEDVFLVQNAEANSRVRGNLAVRDLGVIAYLGVLLRMRDGSVLGSLCAIDRKDRDWEPEDIAALWDLAQIVMDEIALRLEMAKRHETDCEEKRDRELYNELEGSLVAVQSILDSSTDLTKNLMEFREAVTPALNSLLDKKIDEAAR